MANVSSVIVNGNGNDNSEPNPQRTYQAVVIATRDMGIAKDGKLPWTLPTDQKFFEDITTVTSDPGKKNAVVMGRKSWEAIPPENRPLRGRLNIILTRSGSFEIATADNVLICGSVSSAMELLASSPYCQSIEKVFLTGGAEIFRYILFDCLIFIIMLSFFFVVTDDFYIQRGSSCTWMRSHSYYRN
jgi:dihydrofolate reductase / thymidylate synthase